MPDKFDLLDLLILQEELTLSILETLDELLLATSLNLSKHSAATSLNLPVTSTFANFEEFRYAVISNRARLLNLLVCMIDYNVAIYNKMLTKYCK